MGHGQRRGCLPHERRRLALANANEVARLVDKHRCLLLAKSGC